MDSLAANGADAIRAEDLRQVIEAIAHDSMQGRLLRSRGLEATAAYMDERFRPLGLLPAENTLNTVRALLAQLARCSL